MGDDYVVIKLWEKVFLEKKIQCKLYFQERVFAGQIRIKDDVIMNQ